MAVDELAYRATEALILPSPRKFYRATIHAYHWQLRSLIGSPHDHCVYYPTGSAIYRLNTKTSKRELVTTIKFIPRCLSAAHGWICCGGEEGQFAVIRLIEDTDDASDRHVNRPAAADARLPLDLDTARSTDSLGGALSSDHDSKETSFVRTAKIGEEIVNCVTFWFPPSNASRELYNAPVAVLANNDHTVTIADLQSSDALQTIKFTDCINRAVISPDGRLLIAIGDDPFMYVFSKGSVAPRGQNSVTNDLWKQANKIQLVGQYHSDKADTRGSFAASFSASGKYLAIGTQYGIICIFDTACLTNTEADPLITAFATSRPKSKRGAVRDLEFSPEPFDLLTWTENTGRVGVADARDNFTSRQIISLDSRAEGITRVGLTDRDEVALIPDATYEGRYRSIAELFDAPDAERSDSPDLLSAELQHRRLREELTNDVLERLHPHVPTDETASAFQVLQALQEQRRARETMREAEAAIRNGESNTNARATMSGGRVTTATLNRYRDLLAERTSSSSSNLPSILREFTGGERSNASLRTYINERNQERERRGQPPRRRGSVILDAAGRALDRESRDVRTARTSQSEANSQDGLTRLPPRLPAIGSGSPNPWTEIETLYNIAVDPPVDISARLRVETEDGRPDRARREHELRSTYLREAGLSRGQSTVDPDETCGCCWSRDGRILFVCTEDGMFEYHVNTNGRKFFPSLTLR